MDTPDLPAPDEPTADLPPVPAPPVPAAGGHPTDGASAEPTAPIALGLTPGVWPRPETATPAPVPPTAGPFVPGPPTAPSTGATGPSASGGWPPPPVPPTAPPAVGAGPGGGAWGPIATPYGLAWGPTPIPPVAATGRRGSRLAAVTALVVALSVLVGLGVGYAVWRPAQSAPSNVASNGGATNPGSSPFVPGGTSGTGSNTTPSGSGNASAGTGIAATVDPGLVDINVVLSYEGESAAGTGQVLTSSGEVLTNNHVIDGATSISATDIGNGRTYTASVVGYDRTGDLAVIQLHGASGLSTVSIGDSSKVKVGDAIVAIGNAGGQGGTPSAAPGTVTTLDQAITASDDGGGNAEQLTGLIEVNANVEPGDSGGPLVNSAGDVVGIDTAAAATPFSSAGGGDGYAIPINEAITIAKQIEAGRSSSTVHVGPTAFLGVLVTSPGNNSLGGLGGLGDQGGTSTSGAAITQVAPGSPAESTGLVAGDVITSLGGKTVSTPQDLSTAIAGHVPGDSVQVQWQDATGQLHSATLKLASGPAT